MPIHEFLCPENQTIYSFLLRRPIREGEVPRCPENPEWVLQRVLSPFAITGVRRKSREEAEGAGEDDLDDPRMERALAEIEREMAGMDEDNPDPRQLGRLMRRMSDLTGEPLGGEMEEMVRRLEEGADPDELEEQFGDALDDGADDPGGAGAFADSEPADASETGGAKAALRRALLRSRGPRRDPRLYDWSDYA